MSERQSNDDIRPWSIEQDVSLVFEFMQQLKRELDIRSGGDIKRWRAARGIGLRELARLLDVDPSTVQRWESGAVQFNRRGIALMLLGLDAERASNAASNAETNTVSHRRDTGAG